MNKLKSLALSGIAALAIGCASKSYNHSKKNNISNLLSRDYSEYEFEGFIGYKSLTFKTKKGVYNFLDAMDTTIGVEYHFFDVKKNDLKIDSLIVYIKGDTKTAMRIGDYGYPEKFVYVEVFGEIYSQSTSPEVIAQAQKEFDRYLEMIKQVKNTLEYKIYENILKMKAKDK